MPKTRSTGGFIIVTIIMMVVIVYGSLYPFEWSVPENGIGPIRTFIGTWNKVPGHGDFVSNILLYLPLGLFGSRAVRGNWFVRLLCVTLLGGALSVSMELTQYYDVGRDTEVSDAYANTMGAALGGLIGVLFRGDLRLPFLRELSANPVATMLLGAWAAYRLYPYVPAIDLHKYWNALKPVVLRPSVDPLHLFHHLAIWLSGALLIEAIFGLRRAAWLFPLFVGGVLFSEILIVSSLLSVDEIAGALCAYVIFLALAGFGAAPRAAVASIVFAAAVFAERLSPFHFVHATHGFGWIPFYSFMQGSIDIDVMSFFEKFYFYGTMLWLLTRAGIGLRWAAVLVAVGLFASSWVEVYLPGRSAEDTDAIMALMIAAILGLIEHDTEAESRPVPAK